MQKGNQQVFTDIIKAKERLDIAVHKRWPDIVSRSGAQKLIMKGLIQVDEKIIQKSAFIPLKDSQMKVTVLSEPAYKLIPLDQNIPILYEDDHLALIHKPAGMTVHPGAGTGEDTLAHSLLAQFDHLSSVNKTERPGIVHRLDRETEGVMIIAKRNASHRLLASQFKNRQIEKEYHAWVVGIPSPPKATISGFIQRNQFNRKLMKFTYLKNSTTSRNASLSYQVEKTHRDYSFLKIKLHTGRTHQIRATLAAIHSPVVGDRSYGSKISKEKADIFGLLLIANKICFQHPILKKNIEMEIKIPKRFDRFEDEISL